MEEIVSWIRPVLSGLVACLIVWAMVAYAKSECRREGDIRHLRYGVPFKIFAALIIPFSAFVVYGVSQSYKGQEIPAFLVAAGFAAGSVFFPYQAFLVRFSYDDRFIYYRSPLVGSKKVPWDKLLEVGYSRILQADYIIVDGIGKIWCSSMLDGYGELGAFLEEKVRELHAE
ncbi:hypothetical protein [Microbulbifer taiwanensis]|uniref:PH domain-containing protein n=1 Tax=Microbulbifer taiwanensis TaxID=986746 RepID=A0ABW1YJS1_9GAMM|nr:hypothetical protein [Microbulbifer taiwanensis]